MTFCANGYESWLGSDAGSVIVASVSCWTEKRLSRAERSGREDNSEAAIALMLDGFPPVRPSDLEPTGIEESAIRQNGEVTSTCPHISNENWAAWLNGIPGSEDRPTLIVTGNVTVPTPGYTIELKPGRADRSMTPVQQMILTTKAPEGMTMQLLTTEQARYEGVAIAPQYKAVEIVCGGEIIARIDEILGIS